MLRLAQSPVLKLTQTAGLSTGSSCAHCGGKTFRIATTSSALNRPANTPTLFSQTAATNTGAAFRRAA